MAGNEDKSITELVDLPVPQGTDVLAIVDGISGNTKKIEVDNLVPGAPVSSVFSRTGTILAAASDYAASQVDNDSGVAGTFVSDALNTLNSGAITSLFQASLSANQVDVTGDGTTVDIVFNTVTDNVGGDYDNTTGKYTAPSDGYAFFSWSFRVLDLTASHDVGSCLLQATGLTGNLRFLDQSNTAIQRSDPGSNDFYIFAGSQFLKVFSGEDYNIRLSIGGGTKVVDIEALNVVQIPAFFSGVMLFKT